MRTGIVVSQVCTILRTCRIFMRMCRHNGITTDGERCFTTDHMLGHLTSLRNALETTNVNNKPGGDDGLQAYHTYTSSKDFISLTTQQIPHERPVNYRITVNSHLQFLLFPSLFT